MLTWEVTQACDLTCDHCRADARPKRDPRELSTNEGKQLLEAITRFDQPLPILVLSGGDPLKRPDLFDLIEHAVSLGLPTAVTPAPTPLLDRDVIEQLADIGVRRIALSLDGATAETHDGFRGEAGSFETIRRTAVQANEVGLSLQINTTVTASTVGELPGIAALVEEFGAAMWEVFFLVPVGRGADLEQLSAQESERVLEWLYRHQRPAPYRVITVEAPQYRRVAMEVENEDVRVGSTRAGHGFLFVSHTGDIYPSGFLPERVGNVREDDIVTTYREAPLLRALRDPDQFRGYCGECSYRTLCGGSRSRAAAITGDPLRSDPSCAYALKQSS